MRGEVSGDLLLIGEVTDVRGTKVKVRVYSQANEASVFYHGELVRGVSVGGYLRLPCGYDDVIGGCRKGTTSRKAGLWLRKGPMGASAGIVP